ATLFGMVLAVNIDAALLCVISFIIILLITRYVSLSSIVGGFAYLIGVTFYFNDDTNNLVVIFGMCICLLILVTHQKNIERLLKGKESKINLFKRKEAQV
ncbi:MAG: glycerol-3-phosphate acyltransferase, partial [Mucilaginibacter sp.]